MPFKRLAIGAWLLLLAACLAVITRTDFRTDMAAFLPATAPLAQQVLTAQVNSGAASHLVLLALDGAPPHVLATLSEALAVRLRQQPAFIDVLNGDAASFADVRAFVWRNRYLLGPDVSARRFTAGGLRGALTGDLALLAAGLSPLLAQTLPSDPTDESLALLQIFATTQAPRSIGGVWFGQDGARALLVLHTAAAGFDIDAQQRDLDLVDRTFATVTSGMEGVQAARLRATGPGVFAVHTRAMTKRDVTRLSTLAAAGALGLLALAYRSLPVLLLGSLPVISGALAGIAAVSLVFGFVHGITVGFGVTLMGESLDYAIYLFTQTLPGSTPRDTLARIWPTLRLGAATSIVGFGAMLFSSFTGFAQLGLFSMVGLLVAAGTTRFVLPLLVPAGFAAGGADHLARPVQGVIRRRRRLRPVAILVVAVSIAVLLAHRGGFWDETLTDLSPVPPADQALADSLQRDLGSPGARYFAVFTAGGAEPALAKSEALAAVLAPLVARHELGGFAVPSTILPSAATQRARQAALPPSAALRANLAEATAGLGFRNNIFAPFIADAEAERTGPLLTAASLPPTLRLQLATMLVKRGGLWDVIAPLTGMAAPAAIAAALAPGGVSLVDLDVESAQLLHRFQREAVALAVIGSLAVLMVLLAGLRAPARALRVVAPLAAAVIVTAAILTGGGGRISIFEVFGFLLIVAVASNYCLFFERAEPDEAAHQRALAAILLANLCTVCAYGLLSLSTIPVLHDIGRTVALGTFLSLVFAALFSARPAPAAA